MSTELTRNFSIIAHIDHGKTTLSDRLHGSDQHRRRCARSRPSCSIRWTWSAKRASPSSPTRSPWNTRRKDGKTYKLNLLDTPGHVDFSYEVSRSLAACEGAILMVDAAQGVEAQTVANLHLANEQNLTIIPVLNKIDLPAADVPKCKKQLEEILSIPAEDAIPASAKAGIGIEDILEAIIARVPAPMENPGQAAALLGLRLALRHLPRRRLLRPRLFRHRETRPAGEAVRHRQDLRGQGSRRLHPEDERPRQARRRRRRLRHRQHEIRQRGEDRRHA